MIVFCILFVYVHVFVFVFLIFVATIWLLKELF